MKKKKSIKELRAIGIILLCCMMILSAFSFVSCTQAFTEQNQETKELEKTEKVVRVRKGVMAGYQIAGEHIELVDVPVSSIPEGAIKTVEEIIGKYASIDMVRGEFIFGRMLMDEKPAVDNTHLSYVVVSDSIEVNDGVDIADALQTLIDSSAGRTIYFTDGVYSISKPIKLPVDKDKAVSLRFSNYAVLKATDSWSGEEAMICVGTGNEFKADAIAEVAVMGGTIDGSSKAKIGVSLENCASALVSNLTFKGCNNAIYVKSTAKSVTVEGFTVSGDSSANSVGVINESDGSVFATGNISDVITGIMNSGKNNEFRNISVSASKVIADGKAFCENGTQNGFTLCTAENYINGFFIKDGAKSVFEACNAIWNSAEITEQNAFVADGAFASTISSCTIRFFDKTSLNAIIKYASIDGGIIKVPIVDESLCDDISYKSVVAGNAVWVN